MILGLAVSFLLRALRWLERMRLALMQARRWLWGRFAWPKAGDMCHQDARTFGRIARQDLRLWRELVLSGIAKREAQAATAATLA